MRHVTFLYTEIQKFRKIKIICLQFFIDAFCTPEQKNIRNLRRPSRIEKSGCVCVLTDKTNSTRVIKIEDYKRWVSDHLQKAADLALRPKVMALYENANLLLEKVKLVSSVKEEEFARQSLATRATPSPKLLIKDHKTVNEKGEFTTRLVIPATNFTATFSNIGYLGIKRYLDKVKVNY